MSHKGGKGGGGWKCVRLASFERDLVHTCSHQFSKIYIPDMFDGLHFLIGLKPLLLKDSFPLYWYAIDEIKFYHSKKVMHIRISKNCTFVNTDVGNSYPGTHDPEWVKIFRSKTVLPNLRHCLYQYFNTKKNIFI